MCIHRNNNKKYALSTSAALNATHCKAMWRYISLQRRCAPAKAATWRWEQLFTFTQTCCLVFNKMICVVSYMVAH